MKIRQIHHTNRCATTYDSLTIVENVNISTRVGS